MNLRFDQILPVGASTELERDLLDTFEYIFKKRCLGSGGESENIEIDNDFVLEHLWNSETCPEIFLPYLAVAMSVDGDFAQFSQEQLRSLIRNSLIIHLQKGTVWSIEKAIESLGYTLAEVDGIIEGRRAENDQSIRILTDGGWAEFSVNIVSTISISGAQVLFDFIESLAPASRKLVHLGFSQAALLYDGGIDDEGVLHTFHYNSEYTYGEVSAGGYSG